MISKFLKSSGDNLIIFFLGYAQDERPFERYVALLPENTALLVVFDYGNGEDALPDLSAYKQVRVIAWSMGVMMAPGIMHGFRGRFERRHAVNGTIEGISDTCGIAPGIWDQTIAELDEAHADNFVRLMCRAPLLLKEYLRTRPERSVESLRRELIFLRDHARDVKDPGIFYDDAHVSKKDLIMPARAVLKSFAGKGVPCETTNEPHYAPETFARLISRPFAGIPQGNRCLSPLELTESLRARRFSRAHATYEAHATVQRQLGEALFERILAVRKDFPRILDVGCGTGAFSARLLSLNPRLLVLNDISKEMIAHCRERFKGCENIEYRELNAEYQLLGDPSGELFDLIASNAAVQWFSNLKMGVLNFLNALNPGGLLAFSTFVEGHFAEIREAGGGGLAYLSLEELRETVAAAFPYSKIVPMTFRTHYPDARSMLRSLKESGVTGLRDGQWTPGRLRRFISDYESRFGDDEGVRLTWQAATVLASHEEIGL